MTFNSQAEFNTFFPNSGREFEKEDFPIHAELVEAPYPSLVYATDGAAVKYEPGCTYRVYDSHRVFILYILIRGWIITDGEWTLDDNCTWYPSDANNNDKPQFFATEEAAQKYADEWLCEGFIITLYCI